MGGNVGIQALSVSIRSIALGEVRAEYLLSGQPNWWLKQMESGAISKR